MDVPQLQQVVQQIISGGQTGVDRGALDAAMALGIDHGGWCPPGRLAEDGTIPARYQLTENSSTEYWVRTEQNVIDSSGTLILYRGKRSGGTEFTYRMAVKHRKPHQLVDLLDGPDPDPDPDPKTVRRWISDNGIEVLNVAGPRESSSPGIRQQACDFLKAVFAGD